MTAPVAIDTSVAIPLLVQRHHDHGRVVAWRGRRDLVLSGHAGPETYSVLTRLPGDLRVSPADAARLIEGRFASPLLIDADVQSRLPRVLADLGIAGGAVYDAMVALAAAAGGHTLATRDARARTTYEAVGVTVEVIA